MSRTTLHPLAALLAILAAPACAGTAAPPTAVECPAGSRRADARCVATEVSCPDGARWDGSKCVGERCGKEPAAPVSAQAIVGDYTGEIGIGIGRGPVQTHLTVTGGAIGGEYTYGATAGRFSDCRYAERFLTCTWTETGLTGSFRVQFSEDGKGFSGEWDFSDGRPGGSWTGRRSAAVAAGPPGVKGPSVQGPLGGVYRGLIGIGSKPGPVVTEIDDSTGKITGVYSYGASRGQLDGCALAGQRLTCRWTEGALSGGFQVDFAADLRSFSGTWDFTGGRPGGTWTGSR